MPEHRANSMCSLERALLQVEKLKSRGDQSAVINQIGCTALSCRLPLEAFLAKLQRYEKNLGPGKSAGKLKDAGHKIQYAFRVKDDVNKLRSYLNIHIKTISMLMSWLGLNMLDVAQEQADKNQEELRNSISSSAIELREVKTNVETQALALRENSSILTKLLWMVSGEIVAPLKCLGQTVTKIW